MRIVVRTFNDSSQCTSTNRPNLIFFRPFIRYTVLLDLSYDFSSHCNTHAANSFCVLPHISEFNVVSFYIEIKNTNQGSIFGSVPLRYWNCYIKELVELSRNRTLLGSSWLLPRNFQAKASTLRVIWNYNQ